MTQQSAEVTEQTLTFVVHVTYKQLDANNLLSSLKTISNLKVKYFQNNLVIELKDLDQF